VVTELPLALGCGAFDSATAFLERGSTQRLGGARALTTKDTSALQNSNAGAHSWLSAPRVELSVVSATAPGLW
jgi:hypothetical protein